VVILLGDATIVSVGNNTGRKMNNELHDGEIWTLHDIPLDRVDVGSMRANEELFLLLAGASFVETGSDLYTGNLILHFRDDAEVSDWLLSRWEPEELAHGRALRAYVNHVWPDFDWEAAFGEFITEYSRMCTQDDLESSRCLEMAARCVVEMGTATYYRTIRSVASEPVLEHLTGLIQRDEVRHYKHFYRYFSKYNRIESRSRASVAGALVRRLREIAGSDVDCGLWHPFHARHMHLARGGREFRDAVSAAADLLRRHYPTEMAVKMLLKPLSLPASVNRWTTPPARLAQRLLWH
jgi:hypothetical protein